MIKVLLAFFATLVLSVSALDKDEFLRELKEKYDIEPLDARQEEEEINNFKNLDRVQQLLEIKRKLMQTLGGVNDAYRELGISSLEVKTEILGILRKVQNAPQDVQQANSVFKSVYQSLDQLIKFIPQDASAKVSQKPQSGKPSAQWPTWEGEGWQEPGPVQNGWQGQGGGQAPWQGQGGGHGGGQGGWQGQEGGHGGRPGSWQGQGGGQGGWQGQGGGQGGWQGQGGGQGGWQGQGGGQEQEQKPGKNPFEGSLVIPEPAVEQGLLTYLLFPICGVLKLCKKLVLCLFAL